MFFLNISQSAVLRKPNVYKEIAVSQFINVYFNVKKEINLYAYGQAWTKQQMPHSDSKET